MRPDHAGLPAAEADIPEAGAPTLSRAGRRWARLAFVLSLTPGLVITMVLAPALRSPTLLAIGVALTLAAFLAHRRLTAVIIRLAADADPDPLSMSSPLEAP
ncbi:hypothetical protein [Caulobacter rhizosphaerae]|uniref:hypothetical protein n=1 Tax=Caulobacter rhizosphaerae TaxID=2010972 RepID=UPI0013D4A078|nr:hypothetical protein [Caulobacter rhizosphaerae]GGL36156.1 hypothetical protein GCM10010983_36560 [Caulobacter rhizosphaerae]